MRGGAGKKGGRLSLICYISFKPTATLSSNNPPTPPTPRLHVLMMVLIRAKQAALEKLSSEAERGEETVPDALLRAH